MADPSVDLWVRAQIAEWACGVNLLSEEEELETDPNDQRNIVMWGWGERQTGGRDIIIGTPDDDAITAGAGNDTVCGRDGDDNLGGGRGADTLHGGDGDDTLRGENGPDKLHGGDGDDTLRGHEGKDELNGDLGENDDLGGGPGNDRLIDAGGSLNGGNGADVCSFATVRVDRRNCEDGPRAGV